MPRRALRRALTLAVALVAFPAGAGEAGADTCEAANGTPSWHNALTWSCGHVPTNADTAMIGAGDDVSVSAAAQTGELLVGDGGTITFSGDPTLAAGSFSVGQGTLTGTGTLTVAGAFAKVPTGGLSILDDVDLVLNGASTMNDGTISVCEGTFGDGDPTLQINSTLTIEDGSSVNPFDCSSTGSPIHVNPGGELIKAAAVNMSSFAAIDNDGTITVEAGTFLLRGGSSNAGGATSDGDYIADADAMLQFESGSPPLIGGQLGGQGTIHVNTILETLAGSTLDPNTLRLSFELRLRGNAPVTVANFDLTGGILDSDRPVTAEDMDVTSGTLQRDFTFTVPSDGSFTKTTGGLFSVTDNGSQGSADLVLDGDASLDGGTFCVSGTFPSPDQPQLHINGAFTIASSVATAFTCGGNDPSLHVNGPDGHLLMSGGGTTSIEDALDVAGGTVTVGAGQTFSLGAGMELSGSGMLEGGGQVTGSVTNSSGTVRPGTSPGTLTVTGNYTQGANGMLEVDVNGTTQGTQFDHLAVGGAANLDGTVAVVKGSGFDPLTTDTFQFLTSASRTGTFDALVGSRLASGEGYVLDYPGAPDLGARLTVTATPGSVAEPTPTETYPDSPINYNTPQVRGTAPPGSTVALYGSADCGGSPVAIGSAADFASPGLTVGVADNTTTTFRATATLGSDTSACSSTSVSYTEDSSEPQSFVVTDCDDPQLAELTAVPGDLIANNVPGCTSLSLPNLTEAGGVNVADNGSMGTLNLASLGTVAGSLDISGNASAGSLDLGSLTEAGSVNVADNGSMGTLNLANLGAVTGSLDISGNGNTPDVTLGSLSDVGGDLTVESEGTGTFDTGPVSPGGDTDLQTEGYDAVTATTAAGATTVENARGEAAMRAQLPAGSFASPVEFTLTRLDPASLPPEDGTAPSGGAATVDPLAAHQFSFAVPTLDSDATLSFEVQVNGLDTATRDAFLAALDSGTATLATKGDAPGGTYQAFPLCAGAQVPTADGCVAVEELDSNGEPTLAAPAIVRFTGITGHFSTWAVALVAPSNEFSFGKVKRNKRKGTAKLTVNVPGPGTVELAKTSKVTGDEVQVGAPGDVNLLVKPRGGAKNKLRELGRAKVRVRVAYAPEGGTPSTQARRITLVRK